jgi:hypothetical protein
MICNVCDRLAAEIGELLMQQERQASVGGEKNEELEAKLQESRQKLIDHRRLIHRQGV